MDVGIESITDTPTRSRETQCASVTVIKFIITESAGNFSISRVWSLLAYILMLLFSLPPLGKRLIRIWSCLKIHDDLSPLGF